MRSAEKKHHVLEHLQKETDPIALKELLEKLGESYSERSVRRWLAEMIQEGDVEKFGSKRSAKYLATHSVSKKTNAQSSCFSLESLKVIEKVRTPIYQREPVTYSDSWVAKYKPNITFYIPAAIRKELHTAGVRSKKEDPAGTYAHQIFNRLLIDLSYNSSRLEGNTYSLLDTKRLVLEGTSVEGKLSDEKTMILNHKEAIRYLVDNAPKLTIKEETICTLHFLLADSLLDASQCGKLREHSVRVGGSTYIPFEEKSQLEIRFDRMIKKAKLIHDPYEQSLFLLIHLSYLQGFADVNKRTARLACNIPLIKNNLVPLSFNDIEKEDYTSAMIAVYELNNTLPLLDLYLFSYLRTCSLYNSTVETLGFDEVRVRYRAQRRALCRQIILEKLTGNPMQDLIKEKSSQIVNKEEERKLFLEDLLEDLREMDASRIAGLGITQEELNQWIKLHRS